MTKGFAFLRRYPRTTILVVLLLLTAAGFTVAQIADPPVAPSSFVPEGALVYAEASDLEELLEWWKGSRIKADWERSENYGHFRNSRLYLKLRDRLTKWGSGGSFKFTLDNLIQAAGDRSALALYDIGELKAVAVTRLPFTEAQATQLWLARAKFEERKSGNRTYYTEPRDGSLCFAYAEPYLIVSSDETLLTRTLSNLDTPAQTLEQSAKWKSLQRKAETDVSLFLDQEALQQNRYFKKYWIHRNVSDFTAIRAAWIDLSFEPGAIVERRYFSQTGTGPGSADVPSSPEVFRQFPHDTLYIDTPVTAADIAQQILNLVNRLPAKDKKLSHPPTFSGAAERATQAETRNILLEQIDEPVLLSKAETMLQASQQEQLEKLLSQTEPQASIRLSYPLWDNQALFVQFPETMLLQLKNHASLNRQQFLDQILEHFLLLHSTQEAGARWASEPDGIFILEFFRPLYVKFHAPWIVISTQEKDFRHISSNLPEHFVPVRYSEVNWKTGRWKYTRLMQRLDHGEYQEDIPLLFSENISSLLAVLDPIAASSVTQTSTGEVVRYELR